MPKPKNDFVFVMKIAGSPLGPTSEDGKYVSYYDPHAHQRRGEIQTVDDPQEALQFDNLEDLHTCWAQTSGMRPDNKPNRPLTAYNIEILPILKS